MSEKSLNLSYTQKLLTILALAFTFSFILAFQVNAKEVKQSIKVPAKANIWLAGRDKVPEMPKGGGEIPPHIDVGNSEYITISSISGTVNFGNGKTKDPDGTSWSNYTAPNYKGIAGFKADMNLPLVGVFISDKTPQKPAPSRLNFVDNINFKSLSPKKKQIFFVGDGKTEDGTVQKFNVPEGATRMYLGVADFWKGEVGYYGSNTGAYTVNLNEEKNEEQETQKPDQETEQPTTQQATEIPEDYELLDDYRRYKQINWSEVPKGNTFEDFSGNRDFAPGTLLKFEGASSVYIVNDRGRIVPFPRSEVFHTYFPGFSRVNELPANSGQYFRRGEKQPLAINYRPGSYLVTHSLTNKVYVVAAGGVLREVPNPQVAKALYGNNWLNQIRDISQVYWKNYEKGPKLDGVELFEGVVVTTPSDSNYYYMEDGRLKRITGNIPENISDQSLNISDSLFNKYPKSDQTINAWRILGRIFGNVEKDSSDNTINLNEQEQTNQDSNTDSEKDNQKLTACSEPTTCPAPNNSKQPQITCFEPKEVSYTKGEATFDLYGKYLKNEKKPPSHVSWRYEASDFGAWIVDEVQTQSNCSASVTLPIGDKANRAGQKFEFSYVREEAQTEDGEGMHSSWQVFSTK
ncbi:MAG: hypothetical protein ABEJ24_05310 [Candidatus Magasanikbacteria bacterium]